MISWMQRNNKYLVPTIWIATIAFIGAGAVGWGNMSLNDSSSSIAKVGDVAIPKMKFNYTYNSLYLLEAQKRGGNFDKDMAKEIGLDKIVYNELLKEALLLNLAREYGIIATDKEVGLEIASYQAFKDKNGVFQKSFYLNFLKSRGLKIRDFETIIRDELVIRKLLNLLNVKPLKFEEEVIGATFNIADKIEYSVVDKKDINVTIADDDIKSYWSKNKIAYLKPKEYKLELLWTEAKDVNFSDEEVNKFYKENSFEFIGKDGNLKPLNEVKNDIIRALTLKKLRKNAVIERSRFKKGKLEASEIVTLNENNETFSKEIWQAIKDSKINDILKPKVVGDKYVTIKINSIIEPKEMSFEEAKELAKKDLEREKIKEELFKRAQELTKSKDSFKYSPKDFVSLSTFITLEGLSAQESFKLMKAIFNSNKRVGTINLGDKIVVFRVKEQKLLDNKINKIVEKEIDGIKNGELYTNLINQLSKRYQIESFVKGL